MRASRPGKRMFNSTRSISNINVNYKVVGFSFVIRTAHIIKVVSYIFEYIKNKIVWKRCRENDIPDKPFCLRTWLSIVSLEIDFKHTS